MFIQGTDEVVQLDKPRRRVRWLVVVSTVLLLLVAAAAALILTMKSWERRVAPPQGYAHGEQLEARQVAGEARPVLPEATATYAIEGTVLKPSGTPADLTLVTARGDGVRTSVYAPLGTFRIEGLPAGRYEVFARSIAKNGTKLVEVGLAAPRPAKGRKPAGKKVQTPDAVQVSIPLDTWNTDPFPAAYYEARLSFASPEAAADFRMQCNDCHQVGNVVTRRPRDQAEWAKIVQRMSVLGAQLHSSTERILPEVLAAGVSGAPAKNLPAPPAPGQARAGTRIREWTLEQAEAYLQDIAVAPDGTIWAVDMNHDTIHALDPQTGLQRHWLLG
jgi:hypothetical protein